MADIGVSVIVRHYKSIKTALRKGNLSGTFVVAKYRFSPYMACEHGCLYCDGRAEKYYVEGQFDRDIVIRPNLPEVLDIELSKLREKGVVSIGSGVSDPYQPAESKELLMQESARTLLRHRFPAAVLTKSSLILNDIDLWAELNDKAGFLLAVSLVFTDDDLRRTFEPRAASVEQRLETLRAFKSAGCSVGVLAMPFMPFIGDSEDSLRRLFAALAEVGVDFIMPGSLTLRPGRQKDIYMKLIADRYPEMLDRFRNLYSEERQSGAPLLSYQNELNDRFSRIVRECGISWLVPHHHYKGILQIYDEVNVLLHHMAELYSDRGIGTGSLKKAVKRYMNWLVARKREYNRRRSLSYDTLDQELKDLLLSGELATVIGNRKLCGFLEDIIINRKTFDYVDLKAR